MTDSMAQHSGLQGLAVWSKAKDFAVFVCSQVLSKFPDEEKYSLKSQLRRSAQSIPANIAEGYGRFYYQSNIHFCYIARGSLEELISQIVLAHDQGYLSNDLFQLEIKKANSLVVLINGYISYLKRSKQGEHEPGSEYVSEEQVTYQADRENSNGSRFSDFDSRLSDFNSHAEGS